MTHCDVMPNKPQNMNDHFVISVLVRLNYLWYVLVYFTPNPPKDSVAVTYVVVSSPLNTALESYKIK